MGWLKLGLKLPKHGSSQVAPSVKKKSHRGWEFSL